MDEADRASPEIDMNLAEAIRRHSKDLAPGKPGDCDMCGEWTGRLVNGTCARCRDKYGLD